MYRSIAAEEGRKGTGRRRREGKGRAGRRKSHANKQKMEEGVGDAIRENIMSNKSICADVKNIARTERKMEDGWFTRQKDGPVEVSYRPI